MGGLVVEHAAKPNENQERSPWNVFIPGALDDFGFTPTEFRIFCHVARRGKRCYSSIPTMAKICQLNKATVRLTLKKLVKRGQLAMEYRSGKPSAYTIVKQSQGWPSPLQFQGMAPLQFKGRGTPTVSGHTKVPPLQGSPSKGSPNGVFRKTLSPFCNRGAFSEACWAIANTGKGLDGDAVQQFISQKAGYGFRVTKDGEPITHEGLEKLLTGFCRKYEYNRGTNFRKANHAKEYLP